MLRSPRLKQNLFWKAAETETAAVYYECHKELEKMSYKIQAAVIDGNKA